MIKNSKFCCFNKVSSPMNYVQFKNSGNLLIKCILQYTNIDETVTKEAILAISRRKRFNLPGTATDICLNILNLSIPNVPFIYHDCVSGLENVCYEVMGSSENPVCIRSIC